MQDKIQFRLDWNLSTSPEISSGFLPRPWAAAKPPPPPPNMARSVEPLRPHSWHVDRCLNPSPKMQSCKSKEAGPNLSCWKWWSGSRLTQICHSHENPPCTATTLMSFHFLCLENSSETLRLSANTRGNKTSEIHISIEQRALHKHTCGFLRLLKTQMSRGRTLL